MSNNLTILIYLLCEGHKTHKQFQRDPLHYHMPTTDNNYLNHQNKLNYVSYIQLKWQNVQTVEYSTL